MNREQWYSMIDDQHISLRFAQEIESTFQEYPGADIIEVMWYSDWGRECAEHFNITELRMPEALRAIMKQFIDNTSKYTL